MLVHGEELRPGAATPALGIRKFVLGPPLARPGEHARRLLSNPVVESRQHLERLVGVEEAHRARRTRIVAERESRPLGPHRKARRCDSVPEAAVDRRLRGEQDRDWFTAFVEVVELVAHELREDSTTTVAREDTDPRHSAGSDLSAWDGQFERKRGRRTDWTPVVIGRKEAVLRHCLAMPFDVVLLRSVTERSLARAHRCQELVLRRTSDLDRHACRNRAYRPSFSSGA